MTGDLWLSLIDLDMRHSRIRPALTDAQVRYRIALNGFPGATCRQQAGVLYLYTAPTSGQPPRLLVQSTTKPDWSFLPSRHGASIAQVKDIGPFWDRVRAGALYRFWLTASPSRAVGCHGGNRIRGTRTAIGDPREQIDWLTRRLDGAATLTDVQVTRPTKTTGRRGSQTVTLTSVTFNGLLEVTDPTALRRHVVAGIGPDKAYGHGLLIMRLQAPQEP